MQIDTAYIKALKNLASPPTYWLALMALLFQILSGYMGAGSLGEHCLSCIKAHSGSRSTVAECATDIAHAPTHYLFSVYSSLLHTFHCLVKI